VIGGLLAFPIAQLILWYLPGEWKRDFGAGPYVARYVPLIVPAKFRGTSVKAESNSEPTVQSSSSVIPDFNFGGGGQFAETGSGNGGDVFANSEGATKPKKKQKATDTATLNGEPAAEEQVSLEDAAAKGAEVFGIPLEVPGIELGGLPLIDEPASPADLADVAAKTMEEPEARPLAAGDAAPTIEPPPPEVVDLAPGKIRDAPRVTADNVAQKVQAAVGGNLAWDNDGASSPSATLKRDFYFSFSKLGEALTFADHADESIAAQVAETAKLLKAIGKQPDKLAVIRGVAKGWMAAGREARKTDGICLAGVVKAVAPLGNLFETTVDAAGEEIAVVSMSDPAEDFAAGREVLILGTILDDPANNLGGYEGSQKTVVLDGFHVSISRE
jgi:hypothetical protein